LLFQTNIAILIEITSVLRFRCIELIDFIYSKNNKQEEKGWLPIKILITAQYVPLDVNMQLFHPSVL
jgi:hypothetical protein